MIEDILKKEYEDLVNKPNQILTIFSEFYGEDNVDMQGLPTYKMFKEKCLVPDVIKYLRLQSTSFSDSQVIYERNSEGTDKSLNNPEIYSHFYQTLIKRIICNLFNKIFILVYFDKIKVTNEYDKFIIPMIESLKLDTSLKYVEINGENSKDDVHDEIIKKINL